jgi:hypothetical protein
VRSRSQSFVDEVQSNLLAGLAHQTDYIIDGAVHRALNKFRAVSPENELTVEEFEYQWDGFKGFVTRDFEDVEGRHQGDHQAALQFLVNIYLKSCQLIGKPATIALHISDLASLSWGIPVTFHPKTFSINPSGEPRIQDYRDHFNLDSGADGLYGVAPIVLYWSVDLAITASTTGFAALLAGPIASACEFVFGKTLGPKLSDWIYTKAGGV